MNNTRYKMKLKLMIPHILYAKWKIEETPIKDFIKKYGYWAWEHSVPTLKIYLNNDFNIIGEQNSFFLPLEEGEKECVFFIPHADKIYWAEYGRCLSNNIFIPFMRSNNITHPQDQLYSILQLPNDLLKSISQTKVDQKFASRI